MDAFASVLLTEKKKEDDMGELKNLNLKLADLPKRRMVRLLISELFAPSESNLKYVIMFLGKIFLKQFLAL